MQHVPLRQIVTLGDRNALLAERRVECGQRCSGAGGGREMSRSPRHESDRIGKVQCSWKRHTEFSKDVARLQIDADTWIALKTQLHRVATGTVRDDEWEYPCGSSHGAIGEIRYDEEGEVRVIRAASAVKEPATIHYRVYFNEPRLCPEELWSMGAGAKSLHPDYLGTDQQTDIDIAVARTNGTSALGVELLTFPV